MAVAVVGLLPPRSMAPDKDGLDRMIVSMEPI
jgi:hypothetical protein